jgi:hypothetical protein
MLKIRWSSMVVSSKRRSSIRSGTTKFSSDLLLANACASWSSRSTPSLLFEVCDSNVQKLRRAVSDGIFRVVPEGFAADQLREVAPDLESHFSETQRQPQREDVVLRISVTDEDRIPVFGRDRRSCETHSVRLNRGMILY